MSLLKIEELAVSFDSNAEAYVAGKRRMCSETVSPTAASSSDEFFSTEIFISSMTDHKATAIVTIDSLVWPFVSIIDESIMYLLYIWYLSNMSTLAAFIEIFDSISTANSCAWIDILLFPINVAVWKENANEKMRKR